MIELGHLTKKIGGAVDKVLCETFDTCARTLPAGKYVSLCFDDFPQSSAGIAAPMIERRGWRATWYVAGQFMGQTTPEFGKMFDASDLELLRKNGHDFGFHTHDHIDCRAADAAEIEAQMRLSEAFFKEHDITARSFAYPFGAVSPSAKRQLAGANIGLRSIQAGTNTDAIDLHMLKACGLQDDKGGTQRALRALDTLSQKDGWLIIFTHDVRPSPSPWGVTPDDYAHLLDAVAESGAEIVTVGDMISRLDATMSEPRRDAA